MLLLGVQESNRKRTNKAKSHCCLVVRTPSPCLPICTLRGVLNAKSVFSLVSAACVDKHHTCNMFLLEASAMELSGAEPEVPAQAHGAPCIRRPCNTHGNAPLHSAA